MFKKILAFFLILTLQGCAEVSTLGTLFFLEPLEVNPSDLRIAIKGSDRLHLPDGAAQLEIKYITDAKPTNIEGVYPFEHSQEQPKQLVIEKKENEVVSVFRLTPQAAKSLKKVQQQVKTYQASGKKGKGSLSFSFTDACLKTAPEKNNIWVSLYLKTERDSDYFLVERRFDLSEIKIDKYKIRACI